MGRLVQVNIDLQEEVMLLRKEVAELKAMVLSGSVAVPVKEDEHLESKITNFLHDIKISARLLGYNYIREAVKLVYQDFDLIGAFSKELYPIIAKKFNTTPTRVARCIRTAMEASWQKNMKHPFYSTNFNEKPTNTEFIALIADKFALEEKLKSEGKQYV